MKGSMIAFPHIQPYPVGFPLIEQIIHHEFHDFPAVTLVPHTQVDAKDLHATIRISQSPNNDVSDLPPLLIFCDKMQRIIAGHRFFVLFSRPSKHEVFAFRVLFGIQHIIQVFMFRFSDEYFMIAEQVPGQWSPFLSALVQKFPFKLG
jgi:hypothetical protein